MLKPTTLCSNSRTLVLRSYILRCIEKQEVLCSTIQPNTRQRHSSHTAQYNERDANRTLCVNRVRGADLRDPGSGLVGLLLVSPVPSGQRVLEAICDDPRLYGQLQVKVLWQREDTGVCMDPHLATDQRLPIGDFAYT